MNNNLPTYVPQLKPHWKWVKLGDVCEVKTGKKDANHAKENGKYRFYTCAKDYLWCDTKSFSGECLILPGNGANVGEVFYYNGEFEAYQRTYILHKIKTLPKYLYYNMLLYWRKRNQDKQYGSATNYIRLNNFLSYDLVLPPLSEQKKIVEKIEELFSQLDSGVAALKKAKEQIRIYRQSVLASAFSGKLVREASSKQKAVGKTEMLNASEPKAESKNNKLPDGWKWVKLGEIIDFIQYGTSDKADGDEKGIPVLRMGNIKDGKIDFSNLKYFNRNYKELNKYLLNDGDLLFNRTNSAELVGKSAVYKKSHPKSIFASYLIRVKVNSALYTPEFLNYFINSVYGRKYIKSVVSQQVGQANVNGTKLKNMDVPLIPLNLQHQILDEIEKRFSEADNLEKAIDESLAKAESLRQSILKQALEGKLV